MMGTAPKNTSKPTDRAIEPAAGFAESRPPCERNEALFEAGRCVFCFDAPCIRACPTHVDVPKFIRQILHDNPIGAAETILKANIFGGSCARGCPTEVLCEGACVENTLLRAPVRIGRLQRYACDMAREKHVQFFEAGPDTGRKVAIVGAGPAGLTCAHELRKQGHGVTIFEARPMPGGLNTYGVAAYKYDTRFALSEVAQVMSIGGIDLRTNTALDGPGIARLLDDYDAVFLGVGLGKTASLGIEGEDLPGVWEALDFIIQTHIEPLERCQCGRRVLVIGGGNTAVDVAVAAVRLGAERVTVAYRRTAAQMPAFSYEYERSKAEGVVWEFSAAPLRILSAGGVASGVEFARTRAMGADRSARLEHIPGSNFVLEADMIVKALGQVALSDLLESIPGLKLDRGRIVVDPATGATSVPRLFAGGDCLSHGAEVVNAVEEGKIAAAGIHTLLSQ